MVSHLVPCCAELTDHIRTATQINSLDHSCTFKLLFMVAALLRLHYLKKTDEYLYSLIPICCSDVSKSMSARQKLETQLTENNIVKEVTNSLFSFLKKLSFSAGVGVLECSVLRIYLYLSLCFSPPGARYTGQHQHSL